MVSSYDACKLSVDVFINFTVIATLVAFFWRGTWDIIDVILLPSNYELSLWVSLIGGSLGLIILTLLQDTLNKSLNPDKCSCFVFFPVSRLHAYIVGVTQVCQWRGIWGLLDFYMTNHWVNSVLFSASSVLALSTFGSLNQATGPPLAISHDLDQRDYFTVVPMNSHNRSECLLVFIKATFVGVLISILSAAYWRGPWNLVDTYVFPDDLSLSACCSLAASIFLTLPILTGQQLVRNFCRNKQRHYIFRTIVEKCYIAVASLVTINHWRGVWYLQIAFLLPSYPLLSAVVSHFVGFTGLLLLFVSRTAAGGGSFEDKDMYGTKSTLFSLSFIDRITTHVNNDSGIYTVPLDT